MRTRRPAVVLGAVALTATILTAPAAAKGGPPTGAGPNPDWPIAQEDYVTCSGTPRTAPANLAEHIDGEGVKTVVGEIAGAPYVGQVPADWDGERLLVWAHGYRGEADCDPFLTVDAPPLADDLVDEGVAWIASGYRRNSYDPGIGVIDTKNVTKRAEQLFGKAEYTYVAGVSMGGHVIGAAIEQYPTLFDGALPACGVMGDVELFDYFLDYNLGAAAIAGVAAEEFSYPSDAWIEETVDPLIKPALSTVPFATPFWALDGAFGTDLLNDGAGARFKSFVEVGSGGERGPIFDLAWDYWHSAPPTGDFFFDLGQGAGTIAGRVGVVSQNSDTSYEAEYGDSFSDLDLTIARVTGSNRVRNAQGTKPAPIINGTPRIPVLTMHTIGDLFVPIEMQQIYAREVAANGLAENLVQRAIRDIGHCTFTGAEWADAYVDLFAWVEERVVPAGENLLPLGEQTDDSGAPLPGIADPLLGGCFTSQGPGSGLRFFGNVDSLQPVLDCSDALDPLTAMP